MGGLHIKKTKIKLIIKIHFTEAQQNKFTIFTTIQTRCCWTCPFITLHCLHFIICYLYHSFCYHLFCSCSSCFLSFILYYLCLSIYITNCSKVSCKMSCSLFFSLSLLVCACTYMRRMWFVYARVYTLCVCLHTCVGHSCKRCVYSLCMCVCARSDQWIQKVTNITMSFR